MPMASVVMATIAKPPAVKERAQASDEASHFNAALVESLESLKNFATMPAERCHSVSSACSCRAPRLVIA